MIYITGDTHNTIDMRNLDKENIESNCKIHGVDYGSITYALVLGDFGLPWFDCPVDEKGIHPENKDDEFLLQWYNDKPFKILTVMGNHDNYNMIEKLPEVDMFGGKVLKVSDNIFYLKRGYIYIIEEKRFLVLGGAQSMDKKWRKLNINYWAQEDWSEEEKKACFERLKKSDTEVDYIVSHTGPREGNYLIEPVRRHPLLFGGMDFESTVAFNDEIDSFMTYKRWFFGHWHRDLEPELIDKTKYLPIFSKGVFIK